MGALARALMSGYDGANPDSAPYWNMVAPFAAASAKLFKDCSCNWIKDYLSARAVRNCFYVISLKRTIFAIPLATLQNMRVTLDDWTNIIATVPLGRVATFPAHLANNTSKV